MRALVVLLAMCACGDDRMPIGEPLARSHDLVVVAHQDDDLYFMQPDLLELVQGRIPLTAVYVTAGDDAHGSDAAERRYAGLRAAYGAAAGSTDWRCGYISIADHVAQHCRLTDRPISLVFLGYPDGGLHGEFDHSLLKLWEGTIPNAETVAELTTVYDQASLIETVAQIIRTTAPATVHTLEVASTHGNDHPDHMIVAAITLLALARAESTAEVIAYRGYSVLTEPENKTPAMLAAVTDMVTYYEACSSKCSSCGEACPTVEPSHVKWFARRYAVGFRARLGGRLQTDTGCLDADLALTAYDVAPSWRFVDGAVQLGDRCLAVSATGATALAACTSDPSQRFFVDDEGHLWTATVPAPDDNMEFAHLWCLAPTDTGVAARLCGRDQGAPSWTFVPPTITTPRAGLPARLQLADVDGDGHADLCGLAGGMVTCAAGDGAGGFAAATPRAAIGSIDPTTFVLGDVDGDHRADVCGHDAAGISCALSSEAFALAPWPAIAATSLAVVDGQLCGADATGVACATRTATRVLSTWPTTPAFPADLDDDGAPDWCAVELAGLSCGVAAEAAITTDGSGWSFSQDGATSLPPVAAITASPGQVCSLDGANVVCARSQGRGFGPWVTVAVMPAPGTALWLGDLDGDGRADACVDLGDQIACAIL